jgi:hypothetical protein
MQTLKGQSQCHQIIGYWIKQAKDAKSGIRRCFMLYVWFTYLLSPKTYSVWMNEFVDFINEFNNEGMKE